MKSSIGTVKRLRVQIVVVSVVLVSFGLSACQSNQNARRGARLPDPVKRVLSVSGESMPVDPRTVKGGAAEVERAAREQSAPMVLRYSSKPWIASAPQPLRDDQRLPDIFYQPFALNHAPDDTGLSLDMLALRVSQVTRVPVRIMPDVYAGIQDSVLIDESEALEQEERSQEEERKAAASGKRTAAPRKLKRYEVQEIPSHLLRWRGDLRGFLSHVADRLDLSWSYEDGTIVISRFLTESFELALFPVRGNFGVQTTGRGASGGRSGAAGASSGGSSGGASGAATGSVSGNLTMNFSEEGQVDSYDSTLRLIENLISTVPGSKMFVTQGSGRILVRSSRVMLRTLRELVRAENGSLTRQVMIQMDIYGVSGNESRNFAVDWGHLQPRLFPGVDMSLNINGASGVVSEFGMPQLGSGVQRQSQALIKSLVEMGYSVQHRPLNMLAMNRQWVRKSRLLSQTYLAETAPAASSALGTGTGVPGLKPGVVTVGDQIMLMPYVLENNTVLLKMAISFSDLLGLDKFEVGQGQTLQAVQIPTTSSTQDSLTVQLRPGEIVALTGLGNNQDSMAQRSFARGLSSWLGGSESEQQRNQHFLVFIRVVLL